MAKQRRQGPEQEPGEDGRTRLDQWLWAARFFKTRALAAEAVAGGKVELNDQRPKRAHPVREGDRLRIRLGPYLHEVTVTGLAARRGSATVAASLYREDAGSAARREELAFRIRAAAGQSGGEAGRPTKKDRRDLARARGRDQGH